MVRILFSVWFSIQGIIENTTCSVWFRIQGIIQNTNSSVCFIIQGIIEKRPGYYSAYGSGFRVLFKTRPAASSQDSAYYSKYELQRLVHYSGYYSKMVRIFFSVWFSIQGIIENTTCSVWFRIQCFIQNTNCSVWFIIQGIIEKMPGHYSVYGSGLRILFKTRPAASGLGFSVLFKIRAAASGSLFRVLLKNGQEIIQRMVQYSGYY